MSSADDAVGVGGRIDWGRVAQSVVGGLFAVLVYGAIEGIDRVSDAVRWAITGTLEYSATLISAWLGVTDGIISETWLSAIRFVVDLEILAFPVAALIAFSALLILYVGLGTMIRVVIP